MMRSAARPELTSPDLVELLGIDQSEFDRRFRHTPLRRAKRTGLVRNACIALGNIGNREALPSLEKIAAGSDNLLAEHASWAMQEIETRAPATG